MQDKPNEMSMKRPETVKFIKNILLVGMACTSVTHFQVIAPLPTRNEDAGTTHQPWRQGSRLQASKRLDRLTGCRKDYISNSRHCQRTGWLSSKIWDNREDADSEKKLETIQDESRRKDILIVGLMALLAVAYRQLLEAQGRIAEKDIGLLNWRGRIVN